MSCLSRRPAFTPTQTPPLIRELLQRRQKASSSVCVCEGENQFVRAPLGAEWPLFFLACPVFTNGILQGSKPILGLTNQFARAPESAGPLWKPRDPLREPRGPYFSDLPGLNQRYMRCNAVPFIFYKIFLVAHSRFLGRGAK